jgi:dUTP pyrophosphatase
MAVDVKFIGQRPAKGSKGAAAYDLTAQKYTTISPGAAVLIPTGLRIQLPRGYEAQVRPRSGLALRHSVTVLNTPGTIDSDYTGEVGVILINHGSQAFEVHPGDRIAQLVVAQVCSVYWVPVDELEKTERGGGGFGSTGLKTDKSKNNEQ